MPVNNNNPFFQNWATGPNQFQQSTPNYGMMQRSSNAGNFGQPQSRQPVLCGRIVNDPNEIVAREVPMDGIGMFPTADGNCIYVKTWTNNGTIQTDCYLLNRPDQQPAGPSEFDQVMNRLTKLEEMLLMINPDLKAIVEQQQTMTSQNQEGK